MLLVHIFVHWLHFFSPILYSGCLAAVAYKQSDITLTTAIILCHTLPTQKKETFLICTYAAEDNVQGSDTIAKQCN